MPEGLHCWDCRGPATAAAVCVESVIHGRAPSDGGPYRSWTCRECRAENGVLLTGNEPWLLIPLVGRTSPRGADRVLEALLSSIERRRLARARAWWERSGAEVLAAAQVRARPNRSPAPAPDTERVRRAAPAIPQRRRATSGPLSVLGLFDDATPAEIRRAWRSLAKRWHPDRAAREGVSAAEAARRFREVRAAWEALR